MNDNEDFKFLFIFKFHKFDFDICLERSKLTEEDFFKKVKLMVDKGYLVKTEEKKKLPYDLSDAGIVEMLGNQTEHQPEGPSIAIKYLFIILAMIGIAILFFLLKP